MLLRSRAPDISIGVLFFHRFSLSTTIHQHMNQRDEAKSASVETKEPHSVTTASKSSSNMSSPSKSSLPVCDISKLPPFSSTSSKQNESHESSRENSPSLVLAPLTTLAAPRTTSPFTPQTPGPDALVHSIPHVLPLKSAAGIPTADDTGKSNSSSSAIENPAEEDLDAKEGKNALAKVVLHSHGGEPTSPTTSFARNLQKTSSTSLSGDKDKDQDKDKEMTKENEDVATQHSPIPSSPEMLTLQRLKSFQRHPPIAVPLERITVLGAGSFGTAIGAMFARNGHSVVLLDRNPMRAEVITRTHKNPSYLKEVVLPETLWATTDAEAAFKDCTMVFHAVPVQGSEDYLSQFRGRFPASVPVVCMSKGIHCETLNFMSDIVPSVFGVEQKTAFLSGPSFAREIATEEPTGLVVASSCADTALRVAMSLANDKRVRAWTTDDVVGVEVGGALKNVYAIGAGIVQGAGYGYNTTALMVTRGCLEMAKLAKALGARSETLSGLSGIGDLMLTCFGPASRNRSVGEKIGKGETLEQVLEGMKEVAEGVPTIKSAVRLARKLNMLDDLPLLQCIHDVVFGHMPTEEIANYIMALPISDEMA